MFRILD